MLSFYIHALLISQAIGSTYYVSTDTPNDYLKCSDGPDDICNIYCDETGGKKPKEILFDCGNSRECYFYCEQRKCADNANIIATNSSNLHIIVNDNADECMKNTIIHTPNYGNATFEMGNSKKGFRSMKVYAGSNTENIIINAQSTNVAGDDVKEMEIHASTAKYVQLSLGDGIEWENGILECPIYTNVTPCMIYGSNAILKNTQITANNGIPKNIYIEYGIIYSGTNTLICNSINGTNVTSIAPFDINSECWFTYEPTVVPTLSPTYNPTYLPTESANNPTKIPTTVPTQFPTYLPSHSTNNPTYLPTEMPTYLPSHSTNNPTKIPTTVPTQFPTQFPTYLPSHSTNNPTYLPTEIPTHSPSHSTNNPTKIPTTVPTQFPTFQPTYLSSTDYSSKLPSKSPTLFPSASPTEQMSLTMQPTKYPSKMPSKLPTSFPTTVPTGFQTNNVSNSPTEGPTSFTLQINSSNVIDNIADSNSIEQLEPITTDIPFSYSSEKHQSVFNLVLQRINITWSIIAVLIVLLCCCGCCLLYYIHSAHKQQSEISQKVDAVANKLEKNNNSAPPKPDLEDLEAQKYTIPQKLNIAVPSKSSAAPMGCKSVNSSDGYDMYVNALNMAASPYKSTAYYNNSHNVGEDSIDCKSIPSLKSPTFSNNNIVGSYVNYNINNKPRSNSEWQQLQYQQIINRNQQWNLQRQRAVSYQHNPHHPHPYYPNYNKSYYINHVFKQNQFQPNVPVLLSMPPASYPRHPSLQHVFSPSQPQSPPRPSPYINNNLLNALPPPPPESASTLGCDVKLNETDETDESDNSSESSESSSTHSHTDTHSNNKLNCDMSLFEQKVERLELVQNIKNKSILRRKLFKPSQYSVSTEICHDDEKENNQFVQLHNALKSMNDNSNSITPDAFDDANESGKLKRRKKSEMSIKSTISNQTLQTVITIEESQNEISTIEYSDAASVTVYDSTVISDDHC